MEDEYRQLCLEIFGTDNIDEIRINCRKTKCTQRGEKEKFSEEDVSAMR